MGRTRPRRRRERSRRERSAAPDCRILEAPAPELSSSLCQICGDALTDASVIRCPSCDTPHHADCWQWAGGCSTFGCQGGRSSTPAPLEAPGAVEAASRATTLTPDGQAVDLSAPQVTVELDTPLERVAQAVGLGSLLVGLATAALLHGPAAREVVQLFLFSAAFALGCRMLLAEFLVLDNRHKALVHEFHFLHHAQQGPIASYAEILGVRLEKLFLPTLLGHPRYRVLLDRADGHSLAASEVTTDPEAARSWASALEQRLGVGTPRSDRALQSLKRSAAARFGGTDQVGFPLLFRARAGWIVLFVLALAAALAVAP